MGGVHRAVILAVAVVSGCVPARTAVWAEEVAFPNEFVQAGEWENVELVLDLPERLPSLDGAVNRLQAGMAAGIRAAKPDSGVTITVPADAPAAQEVHLFITVIGGTN